MKTISKSEFVHPIFALDAVLSAGLGLGLLAGAEHIHAWSGAGLEPATLRLIGLLLLPWAIHNYRVSKESPLSSVSFAIQFAGDLCWILGSMFLLIGHGSGFSAIGWLLYGPQMVLVCSLLVGKVASLRRGRLAMQAT